METTGAAILDHNLTASQADFDRKIAEALAFYGVVDVPVNNAGYMEGRAFYELT